MLKQCTGTVYGFLNVDLLLFFFFKVKYFLFPVYNSIY